MLNIKAHYKLQRDSFKLAINVDLNLSGLTLMTGGSGSGKTTLLRLIAGLDNADEALLSLDGEIIENSEKKIHVANYKRGIVYQFQQANLFDHLTVKQNLQFAYKRSAKDKYNIKTITHFKLRELIQMDT